MSKPKSPSNSLPRKIARIFLKTVLIILLLIVVIFFALLTPPVQRFITKKTESYLENKLHTKVSIGRIAFGLSGKISLNNVYIEDQNHDTLLAGGSVKGRINFVKLFSNEFQVKNLEFHDITAKIKRVLPDTVFNFQFIVDAFTTESAKNADTASSAPLKLDINRVLLDNVNIAFTDVISGSDMFAHVGSFTTNIDTLDPYTQNFVFSSMQMSNSTVKVKQVKSLVDPRPLEAHINNALTPSAIRLRFGKIDLNKVNIDYSNDVSALYTTANIGSLQAEERSFDLQNFAIDLKSLTLNQSNIAVRLGKTQQAEILKQEISKEVKAQKQVGWNLRIANLDLNNNTIKFDDDNSPLLNHGLDYSHLSATDLTLSSDNIRMTPDSITINIKKGSVNEKSGLVINQLSGDIIYANNQTSARNLFIQTPGTEIKRSFVLNYPSLQIFKDHPEQSSAQIELVESRIQVKDILLFAPQLRSNPAMRNPNDIWQLNITGSGTLGRFNFETLQFSGLRNTQIDAHGSLTGLNDLKNAGGNFVINRLHTNQTDIALFTGSRLSNEQVNLPEDFTIRGTINGNTGTLNTKLEVSSKEGVVNINGQLSQLSDPATATYNAVVTTNSLQLGNIMRQPEMFGGLSARIVVNGKGMTPETVNTEFTGDISSAEINNYPYRNITMKGFLNKKDFEAHTIIKDPNADADVMITGNFSNQPAFNINGMVDSIKMLPLHLTDQPLTMRGKITGHVSDISADNITSDIFITQALFVSADKRLALDTISFASGKNDTANYMRLQSSIANASVSGEYKISELGVIIQQAIQPYFAIAAANNAILHPYNFNFSADVMYHPVLSAFIPDLTDMKTLHASGNISNERGIQATLSTPYIVYQGNTISDLNLSANTTANGLQIVSRAAQIRNNTSLNILNPRINAVALNNNINFNVAVDDKSARTKYYITGLLTQPSNGIYNIHLKPDSLLLNYQRWTVSADNLLIISPTTIAANNLILQSGNQSISVNSPAGTNQQVNVGFTNFRLATITGFINADSVFADGMINGQVQVNNFMKELNFTSDLTINDLTIRGDTAGNLAFRVNTAGQNRYTANATLSGRGNDVSLTGGFITGNDVALDLNLNIKALQMHSLETFLQGMIRNSSGAMTGDVAIRGTVSKPDVQGKLNFNQSRFALSQLGSQFFLDNQQISVDNNGFVFKQFSVKDSAGNALVINGNVTTSNYINYRFDLTARANNFQLLNSTKKDNDIYYGRMNVSANLKIAGTEIKPVVDGRVVVNDGTNLVFVVPQADAGVASREGIVEFVDMGNLANDTLFRNYDSLNNSGVLGMDVALNIEVKKEAIFNIVVDAANGDFLNAQGEALLTAGIDPSGKITLTGNYTLDKGSYQLSFNFLQRKFDITKGSTITWTGEPTSALLNVSAMYVANTAPIDLVQNQIASSAVAIRNTYMQKLPFEVHLNLTGELMKPVVAFDILLPDDKNYGVANDIVTTVQYRLAQLRDDEGETNKQVFSLLLLNRFVGENPLASAGSAFSAGSYVRQSASKLLTEQLNSLAAGLINGVDIDFNVASTEDYTTGSMRNRTDLNVGVSKRLLNERLKISVGSNFELEGPKNTNRQGNNIAGNVAVDYQLSRDGRYFIRYFRKNDYEGVVDGYIIENGLSFIITIDYNRFREILHRRKQRVTTDNSKQNKETL